MRGIKSPFATPRLYDHRHQCVTEMPEAGVPEGVIRELVGHVDPTMTRLYSHPRLAAKRAAVEVLSTVKASSQPTLPERGCVTNYVTKALPGHAEEENNRCKCLKRWYAWQDSNLRPVAPEATALSI